MKIYDISQEVFSCAAYPGDPRPEQCTLHSTESGDLCNRLPLPFAPIAAPMWMRRSTFYITEKP